MNDLINEIYSFYKDKINKKTRLTKQGEDKIKTRLKIYKKEELMEAILRFSQNNWWMTHNANRGIVWFFKSDEQIARFLLIDKDRVQKVIKV